MTLESTSNHGSGVQRNAHSCPAFGRSFAEQLSFLDCSVTYGDKCVSVSLYQVTNVWLIQPKFESKIQREKEVKKLLRTGEMLRRRAVSVSAAHHMLDFL
jgi:hypothetical protein